MMNSIVITNILYWNCRGISNVNTKNRIWDMQNKYNPQILCLVETKVNEGRCHSFCRKMSRNWDWVALPSLGMSGGIMTLWKKNIGTVTLIAMSRNIILLVVSTNYMDGWILSVVYNPQMISAQTQVWTELSKFSCLMLPWLMVWDFNAIRLDEEHREGSFRHYIAKSKNFNDFICFNSLFDLGFFGHSFTWCNGQQGVLGAGRALKNFLPI